MRDEMAMQKALEDRMKELLKHANLASVARELGLKRTSVWRWTHGEAVTPGAVSRVQRVVRPDLADTERPAAPDIPERLEVAVARLETLVSGLPELIQWAQKIADDAERERDEQRRDAASADQGARDPAPG